MPKKPFTEEDLKKFESRIKKANKKVRVSLLLNPLGALVILYGIFFAQPFKETDMVTLYYVISGVTIVLSGVLWWLAHKKFSEGKEIFDAIRKEHYGE